MRQLRFFTVALLAVAGACANPSAPAPTEPGASAPVPAPPPPPPPTPAPAPGGRLQMAGRVLDENGAPVPNAVVEVDYSSATGASSPPSICPGFAQFCWLATRTNERGEYSVEFEPRPWAGYKLGYVYAFREGYEVDVQWVPTGPSPIVQDLTPRATRPIVAGASTVVSVGPTSSLCTDLEDNWALGSRCEIVVIESGPGTVTVEAHAVAGGVVASMYWYTSGNYSTGVTRLGPGKISFGARGGFYRVLVGLPEGAPANSFNVTTSLR